MLAYGRTYSSKLQVSRFKSLRVQVIKLNKYSIMNTMDLLLDKIDEVRANSVTPEKFEKMWGYSIDEYLDKMMAKAAEIDAQTQGKK